MPALNQAKPGQQCNENRIRKQEFTKRQTKEPAIKPQLQINTDQLDADHPDRQAVALNPSPSQVVGADRQKVRGNCRMATLMPKLRYNRVRPVARRNDPLNCPYVWWMG